MKFDIDFFSFISIFIPLIIGLILFNRVLVTSKILILFITLTALLEVGVMVFYYLNWNNLIFFHLHTFIEFTLLSIIYIRLIRNRSFRLLAAILIPVFVLFSFYAIWFIQDTVGFNSIQRHVGGTILICYALFYIRESREYQERSWYLNPFLIFSISFLLYFIGSMFVFIFANEMFKTGEDAAWAIHGVLNILLNLGCAVVIRMSISKPKAK